MKVLILTVGTGKGVADGLAFSWNTHNPDKLCLLVSKESLESTIPELLLKINKTSDEADVHIEETDQVNDIELLFFICTKLIDGYLSQRIPAAQIIIDFTSGTKAMSAGLATAAFSRKCGAVSYVSGSRDLEYGRVRTGTERVSTLSPNAVYTEQNVELFKHYFNRYQFQAALSIFENEKVHPIFHEKADLFSQLAQVFDALDKFQFNYAFEKLLEIDLKIPLIAELGLRKKLTAYKSRLNVLEQKELKQTHAVELFANAGRRAEEGKFDDAVARLYRTLEMLGQIEFAKAYGCKTDEATLDVIPDELKDKYSKKYSQKKHGQLKLSLFATFEALPKEFSIYQLFSANKDSFQKCAHLRNYSILAHGSQPISKDKFEKYKSFVKLFLGDVEIPAFPKL